ncbi:MAG TPA: LysM peptidoglycan-binding domain-containing protein, partial [Gemmatimonadales bacterium]|nr:LysM peptidoglycan-binding domain-containing protein [Gemmatimonadales bacterium]
VDSAVAADSVADALVLDQLATAHPVQDSGADDSDTDPAAGGANSASTGEVTYDIDVATYGQHARVQYYLDFFQGAARDRFNVWLHRLPRYEPMIRAKLHEYGVPEDMVYLALIESGFSNTAVSRARATGMWQFMKGTAKLYGLRVDSWVDERRDPIKATDAAARHLADLRDQFGSMYLAAAAYNAGAGRVGRGLRRLGDEDEEDENPDAAFFRLYDTRFLRRETKDYVPKLIAAALIAKQPEKYGFDEVDSIAPLAYDSIIVPDATGLDVLARLADTTLSALRDLNPEYIRLVTPPRRSAVVRLPIGRGELVTQRYAALVPKSRVSYVEHIVRRGQTLGAIARMYRISARLIEDANPTVRARNLRIGTRLLIPTSYVPSGSESRPRARVAHTAGSAGTTTIRYRVRSGESLWTIADQYNTTVARLRSLNAFDRHSILRAGQMIRVPAAAESVATTTPTATVAASSRTHLVRRGETLSTIAAHYHTSVTALQDANNLSDTTIKAGARLVIPD